MLSRTSLWTLDELCARVSLALAVDYTGQASGRVRDVPDLRTIRYYSTLGLLDRPAEMRGRTALYCLRHLRQLVAVKRLQTHGLSLAEIQSRLLGVSETALQELAQLPADLEREGITNADQPAPETSERREPSFWRESPAQVEPAPRSVAEANTRQVRISLAPGVDLVLNAARPLDDHDLSALAAAATPLLKLLRARRLSGEGSSP
jgi:DNA-binding transcriptional MerR regulator